MGKKGNVWRRGLASCKENGKGVKQKTGNDKTVGTHGERVRNACEKDK